MNAKIWIESIEEMVTTLGEVGDQALETIHNFRKETRAFFEEHEEQMRDMNDELEVIKTKQIEYHDVENRFFEDAQANMEKQHAHMEVLHSHLMKLIVAVQGFVSLMLSFKAVDLLVSN
jgi:hypothetical protein